jgi:IclR family acetate operon transcriptional repressor
MDTVRAAERALDILLGFSLEASELSITDIERRVGLPRPTLYRLLRTLQKKRLIRSVGEPARYRLDYGVVKLAHVFLSDLDLARVAEPVVKRLRDDTDETAALYIPVGHDQRVCILEYRSRQALSYSRGVGYAAPVHEGASGKIILAFLPDAQRDEILRSIENIRRRVALKEELKRIRDARLAVTSSELIVGSMAIAAPILDSAGGVLLGSICLFGPEARLEGPMRDRCISLVKEAGLEISAAFGYEDAA